MSDDLSTEYLRGREEDPELEADLARIKGTGPSSMTPTSILMGIPARADLGRLGRNTLIAAYDAVRNAGELALDTVDALAARAGTTGASGGGGDVPATPTPKKQAGLSDLITGKGDPEDVDLYDIAPDFMKAADGLRDRLAAGSTTEDVLLQKGLQFAVPFAGTMKALKGMEAIGKYGKIARLVTSDAIVSGTVWDPHEGRFADFLRAVAPDSSLVNAATSYLASDPDDSDAEGRFKNIIDSQLAGGLAGGFIFAAAKTLKGARFASRRFMETEPMLAGGKQTQGGMVSFHGSSHKFDKFDSSKIGTGEGAQVYGHGLYLAENPSVAGSYVKHSPELDAAYSQRGALRASKKPVPKELDKTIAELESKTKGSFYEVDLPDEYINKMLDWDATLSEQPEHVKAVLRKFKVEDSEIDGWKELARTPEGAKMLAEAGIPGIRYLDAGSRSTGKGTRNFVVFDDKILKILKRE